MAKKKYDIKQASIETLTALDSVSNMFAKGVKMSVRKLAAGARRAARSAITSTRGLPQKYARLLPSEIGIDYSDGGATIYAPVTNTEEMRNQMYWTEHGTGRHSSTWGYYTTEYDKNRRVYKNKKGKLIGVTDYSPPVHYMRAAREFLVKETRGQVESDIKLLLTKMPKYYKRPAPDQIFDSVRQGSMLLEDDE